MKNSFKITWLWFRLRLGEGFLPKWRVSGSKGRSIRDGALAMAVVRVPMENARFLIENGADSSVENWLPFRMAAANGDVPMLSWLLEISKPSAYALSDAMAWARGKDQKEAARFLENLPESA